MHPDYPALAGRSERRWCVMVDDNKRSGDHGRRRRGGILDLMATAVSLVKIIGTLITWIAEVLLQ
jgi:hypothetical protein